MFVLSSNTGVPFVVGSPVMCDDDNDSCLGKTSEPVAASNFRRSCLKEEHPTNRWFKLDRNWVMRYSKKRSRARISYQNSSLSALHQLVDGCFFL